MYVIRVHDKCFSFTNEQLAELNAVLAKAVSVEQVWGKTGIYKPAENPHGKIGTYTEVRWE